MSYITILSLFGLFFGMAMLYKIGELIIDYIMEITNVFQLTTLFAGFILMAIATGIPELAIALNSLLNNAEQISVGDIIGSNLVDIAFVLGFISLFFKKIIVPTKNFEVITILFIIASGSMCFIFWIQDITKPVGVLLITMYFMALWYMWKQNKTYQTKIEKIEKKERKIKDEVRSLKNKLLISTKFILGMIGIFIVSKMIVISSLHIATVFNLKLEIIGAAILSIQTSLSELILGIHAAKRGEYNLVLGNSLGSVFEQGTLILGILACLSKNKVTITPLMGAAPFMAAAFIILGISIFVRKKITKIEGGAFLTVFLGFFFYYILQMQK